MCSISLHQNYSQQAYFNIINVINNLLLFSVFKYTKLILF